MTVSRQTWVVLHRWAGLSIALFTLIVGVTGAIIPWQTDIRRIVAPERFVLPPAPGRTALPWTTLRRIAEARSGGAVDYLPLTREPDEAATFGVAAHPGAPPLGFDEIVIDPYDGHEIARDRTANLADGAVQIVPFLYQLHMNLALGGWGEWTLGIAAVVWTIDCFVGFYLSLPAGRRRWWRHWAKSWRIRWRASNYRFNFDLHRAGGLWIWPMLLVFAWSSVGMNMRAVYDPVMTALTGYRSDPGRPAPTTTVAPIGWDRALATARRIAAAETHARGLHVERERVLYYDAASSTYSYAVRTERDRSDDGANSYFAIDAGSGQLLRVAFPTGERAGNTIDYWLGQLHVAGVFGLPYRILVSIVGLLIATLSVTGVVVWMHKRAARLLSRTRHRRAGAAARGAAAGHGITHEPRQVLADSL